MTSIIRITTRDDIGALKEVVDESELFPSEYLEEMMSDYFQNPDSKELWFSCTLGSQLIGFAYCVPEKFTEGTYNLLAIAVLKKFQGRGDGKKMIRFIESVLSDNLNRILIVETSGGKDFAPTRAFYDKLGYSKEATIRDFWQEGEDKVIYWKKLS